MSDDDDQMKALFTTVGAQPGPPLGFTADTIARRGRRIRLARWGAGAAASLVVAAALTVTVALTSNRDMEPGTPPLPGPQITTTDTPTATPDIPTTDEAPTTTTTTTTPPEYTTTENDAVPTGETTN
jgi:hypothetical protein